MKKRIQRLLLIMCVSASVFAFTACGNSDSSDPETQKEDVKEEDKEAEEPAEEEPAAEDASEAEADGQDTADLPSGKFATIEEMINSDLMKDTLESQLSSLEGSGISASLAADGNKLIYNFTIEDPNLAAAMDTATLESSLDSQASTFGSVASSLSAAVEVENPVIVVRYLDSNGNELASREFTG